MISNDPVSGSALNPASAVYKRELTGPHVQNFRLSLAIELATTLIKMNNVLHLVYNV
jgi:hypothetical protein